VTRGIARPGPSSRADFCRAGLAILRDEGPQAATVDRLCAALGRTKGSFYHHFRDAGAFQAALLAEWEAVQTEQPIAVADGQAPARRAAALREAVVKGLDHPLDRAVRAWGRHDARVREAIRRVDRRRIAFLAGLHRARGRRRPERLAELEYAAFVGAQELGLVTDPERGPGVARALEAALEWLGRPPTSRRRRSQRA